VVFLGDGAPDDITAAMYLMLDESILLRGIVVTNGETHPRIAITKWMDFTYAYMGWNDVQVVAGCDCAVDPYPNQFPEYWRSGADDFWGLSLPKYTGTASEISGDDLIIQLANEFPQKLVVLITGPHTDLALALRKDPTLKNKIKKVSIMGGAVEVAGNIHADFAEEENLVSEWNIWVDALAASEVFASGIPLDIIPMDAVSDVYLNRQLAQKVDDVNLPGADLMAQLWEKEFGWWATDSILIWDVLAAIAIDHPDAFEWVNSPVIVVTDVGPDQGRTVAQAGTSTTIRYARHADEQNVLDALYYVFSRR
jgi:inosine-uridine nucleoside N-ribohydrolase